MVEQQDRNTASGLNTKMDELIHALAPKKKEGKRVKLPKIKKAKLRQNYVLVIYIMDNFTINMDYVKIKNETIFLSKTNTYHLVTSKYVMNYKGIPTIIQPTWSLEPLCPSDHYTDTVNNNNGSNPQKALLTLLENANLKVKGGKTSGKVMLWIIIGVVVLLYLIAQLLGKA